MDSIVLLFFVSSYIMNDSMFKWIDILYMYIFSILDLKCCSYGCGCRRECRAPDFSTGPQNGKLNKNSYTIFTIWFIYKCMPIWLLTIRTQYSAVFLSLKIRQIKYLILKNTQLIDKFICFIRLFLQWSLLLRRTEFPCHRRM